MNFYNERAVLLATLCFGSKISGNADLAFVEVVREAILLPWEAQIRFLPNCLERYNFSSY
jgi:hypothetical protein